MPELTERQAKFEAARKLLIEAEQSGAEDGDLLLRLVSSLLTTKLRDRRHARRTTPEDPS